MVKKVVVKKAQKGTTSRIKTSVSCGGGVKKKNENKEEIVLPVEVEDNRKNRPVKIQKKISQKNNTVQKEEASLGKRTSYISRNTSETSISLNLNIDGSGKSSIKTGISFLDHMLDLFSRHGYFDLQVKAKGDIDVDNHHTNEDVAITLGEAFLKALGEKKGINRYGTFYVPMEDVLVRVVLDISNRACVVVEGFPQIEKKYYPYNYTDCEHFLKSFANAAGINMHVTLISGRDRHHIIEAVFKALSRALDIATKIDSRNLSVPSTKGIL